MRRAERQTDDAYAMRLFEQVEWVSVATTGTDGQYVVPMTPIIVGPTIYLNCASEGKRLYNLHHDKRVCIACVGSSVVDKHQFSMEYESAIAFGSIEFVDSREEKKIVLDALSRRFTDHCAKETSEHIERLADSTVVLKVALTSITGKIRKRKDHYT